METRERIALHDTPAAAITKLAEGNPGALSVCLEMLKAGPDIDPDAGALGGFAPLLDLDQLGICGPRIWMLYKDVCGQDLRVTLAILRAHQLGFLSAEDLCAAVDDYGRGIDVPALVAQVEERLQRFQRAEADAK